MVISCAAVNCTNRQGKVDKTEISFHRFPINNARRLARWRRAVRREGWVPNKYSFLCSKHFSPDCFQQRYDDQHRQLKDTAVPSIFDFTPPARGAAGNVRKKVLSPAPGPAEEEDEEEEKIPSEKPRLKAASKSLRNISPPGRESLKAGQDTNRPPRTPQQAVGEWSLGSAEEVFTPSSCTFIDALHSYSSTSRQERDTRARQRRGGQGGGAGGAGAATPSAAALDPQAQLPQEAAGSAGPPRCRAMRYSISARRQQLRRSARQLRRRARQLRSLLQPRKTGLLDKAGPSLPTEAPLNPAVQPLAWLLGTWQSDEPGEGSYPSIQPFRYTETLHISHVGQPVLNFMFSAFHAETKRPLHRECGFIRLQAGTQRVALIVAQNSGLVEIEEGELTGQQLTLQSKDLARISFAKEPYVQQISRVFQLKEDGRLEQTVSMATGSQPLSQHLHITYRRVSP